MMYNHFSKLYESTDKFDDDLKIDADYNGVTLDDIKLVYDIFGGH